MMLRLHYNHQLLIYYVYQVVLLMEKVIYYVYQVPIIDGKVGVLSVSSSIIDGKVPFYCIITIIRLK